MGHQLALRSPQPAPPPTRDEQCLEAFQKHLDYIFRTLRRLGTPPTELDDLAQEVFLALRQSWTDYDPARPLRPYLFGIAFRISASNQRKRRREVALGVVEADEPGPGPDEALQAKQARAHVLAALEHVQWNRRAVVVMHDIDDISVRDISATLQIPLFTVYSRLRKGRVELQSALRRAVALPPARNR